MCTSSIFSRSIRAVFQKIPRKRRRRRRRNKRWRWGEEEEEKASKQEGWEKREKKRAVGEKKERCLKPVSGFLLALG